MNRKDSLRQLIDGLVGPAADALAAHGVPAISAYDLAKQTFLLAHVLPVMRHSLKEIYAALCEVLLEVRLLAPLNSAAQVKAYTLFGRASATPAEIICSLDPFAYVSHLSAMEHHGLTDRFPKILYVTRPSAKEWRTHASARMAKDFGDRIDAFLASGLPRLVQLKISSLGQTSVQFCERSQLGAFRLVSGSSLRVATIGRVFIDMLREPAFCGGIQHVVDVYRREAKRYLNLIVDEVDRHGQPIDKVRAGYLLSEVCKLDAPELASWQKFAQRGGSRKLDSEAEYAPTYSERWLLSINVPSLTLTGSEDE